MKAWRLGPQGGEVAVAAALAAEEGAHLIHLPGGDAAEATLREAVEAWAGGRGGQELVFRSERLLWRPGRMAIIGNADIDTYRVALGTWDHLIATLAGIEARAEALWRTAHDDIDLTHGLRARDLTRQRCVNVATREITRLRMDFADIAPSLERAPPEMEGLARRVVMEFGAMADMPHRLEQLDEKLDVIADIYELANDRLSEFSYFRREYRVEWLIVILLAADLALSLADWLR